MCETRMGQQLFLLLTSLGTVKLLGFQETTLVKYFPRHSSNVENFLQW
jgi:hypothetical protein